MAVARILGLAFGAAGMVWAARCMGPHNYGLSGMVQSIVVQVSMFFSLVHPTILIRAYKNTSKEDERERLVRVSNTFRFWGALAFCIVGALALWFRLLPTEYNFAGWFFIPLIFLMNLQPIWLFQAAEHQHFQSAIAVFQPAFSAMLYFLFFKPGMSAGADLAILSISSVLILWIYWYSANKLKIFSGNPFCKINWKEAKELIQKSGWLFFSSLAVYVYISLELPLVGWLYSIETLGQYRTAFSVVNAAQAIFSIVPALLYPRFIEWRKQGETFLWKRQVKLALVFSILSFFVAVFSFLIIPIIYPLLFGAAYSGAAFPCVILIVSKLVVVVNGIFYWGLMTDHGYDRTTSFAMIGTGFFSLILNLLFIPKFGMYAASLTDLASEMIILVSCLYFSVQRIKKIRTEEGMI